MTLTAGGKVGGEYWGRDSGELELLFHRGELLCGCMDKGQYGRHGLLHGIQVCALRPRASVACVPARARIYACVRPCSQLSFSGNFGWLIGLFEGRRYTLTGDIQVI